MELDDLRRQWQQPEPVTEATFSPVQMNALLRQQRTSLLDKIRRNTYLELLLSGILVVVFALNQDYKKPTGTLYVAISLIMGLLLWRYYYLQVWKLLRQMTESSGAVRGHLIQLCNGLRNLLRLYYRFSMAAVPVTLLIICGYAVISALIGTGPVPHGELGIFIMVILVIGIVLMIPMYFITPWWIQRLYGRHLDRLEGQLRELDEETPAPAQP